MYPENDNGSYRPCDDYDPRRREWFMTITEEMQDLTVLVDTSGSMLNHSASSLIVDLLKALYKFATFDPDGTSYKTLSNSNPQFTGWVSNKTFRCC